MASAMTFLSKDKTLVTIPKFQASQYLEMLARHHKGSSVRTDLSEFDLQLAGAICFFGRTPCPNQYSLRPEGFASLGDLIEFLGISEMEEDSENKHINDFLSYLGLDLDEGDEEVDEYEGWTGEMIATQERETAEEEREERLFERMFLEEEEEEEV
jgi:hypothetical protein